ncbi:hypothetical protein P8452_31823 [Trifolium repens]|nr:hypothetical protein P8452_31823 [Trifolium repens]
MFVVTILRLPLSVVLLPYLVRLSRCLLLLYYGFQDTGDVLIISINTIGCSSEAKTVYIIVFITYAHVHARRSTLVLLMADIGLFLLIFLAIQFVVAKKNHVTILGWICTSVPIVVFAAPLSVVESEVRARNVKSMSIALTISLIMSAMVWLFYNFFVKYIYIYVNVEVSAVEEITPKNVEGEEEAHTIMLEA